MGGTYSVPSPDYTFDKAFPRAYDPPRPADLPNMELIPYVNDNLNQIKTRNNVLSALNESNLLLKELNNHIKYNNIQEKTSEKNVLVYRDFANQIKNQASELIQIHEEYDKNSNLVRHTIDNSAITQKQTKIILVFIVIFFITLGLLIYFIKKRKILPLIKNRALNNLAN